MLSVGTVVMGASDVRRAAAFWSRALGYVPRDGVVYAGDAADQAAEVERLVSLGATRVDWDLYPDDPDFVVLADTEGNRFCVIDTGRS